MLLSGDLATVHGHWESCNITNSIHIRVAGLQLRVHLHTVWLCLAMHARNPLQAHVVMKSIQIISMEHCLHGASVTPVSWTEMTWYKVLYDAILGEKKLRAP